MEVRCPVSLLNSMDLPTLGRPTMATRGFAMITLPFHKNGYSIYYYTVSLELQWESVIA
jgi:hypothetical protein